MKILYLLQQFPKLDSEACIANEISELRKRGHEIRILTDQKNQIENPDSRFIITGKAYSRGWKKFSDFLKEMIIDLIKNPRKALTNLQIIFFHVPYYKNKNFWTKLDNYLILRQISLIKFDLVYSPFAHLEKIDRGMAIAKINHLPFVAAFRALELYGNNCRQEIGIYKKIFLQIPYIVTISKFNKEQLEQIFGKQGKIAIVHSALDPEKFILSPLKNNPKMKIIAVARLVEKKGLTYLLQAIALLNQEGLDLECLLIGDGPLKEKLILEIKELKLEETIKILPAGDQKRLLALLQTADMMVLPCIIGSDGDRDILANSLKEAMAAGLPVITSNISGIEELIIDGKTGLLVPEKDPQALAFAIKRLNGDIKLKSRLSKEGQKEIDENFNIATEIKKLIAVFSDAIANYHE